MLVFSFCINGLMVIEKNLINSENSTVINKANKIYYSGGRGNNSYGDVTIAGEGLQTLTYTRFFSVPHTL